MTRINLIPVSELLDQHLLAEHREIKRIPNCISKGKYSLSWILDEYTMWAGHVKFFYNKLWWIYNRYIELYKECLKRGFNIQNYTEAFKDCPWMLFNNYQPTEKEINLSKSRIQEKIQQKPLFYKYYWEPYGMNKATSLK